MSTGDRKLADLRVCDLKEELEKRTLEVTGNKIALIERLQKAIKDEGHDPEVFTFEPLPKRGTPAKKSPKSKLDGGSDAEKGETDEESVKNGILVDEVGTVDKEDDDEANNDPDMNDNEESINLTIEEDEQKLLHAQAQDTKEEKKTDVQTGSGSGSNSINNPKGSDGGEQKKLTTSDGDKKSDENDADLDKGDEDYKENDNSEQKSSSKLTAVKDEKDKSTTGNKKASASSSRNLWVSGLSSLTRASDLKTIFSKNGKVIGAKVVTNTRTPGTRCYGYVTMASSADASLCIDHLHRTELHGRIISVERTKSEIGGSGGIGSALTSTIKKEEKKSITRDIIKTTEDKDIKDGSGIGGSVGGGNSNTSGSIKERIKIEPDADNTTVTIKKSGSVDKAKSDSTSRKGGDHRTRSPRERSRTDRARRSTDRERDRKRDVLSFQKIREERERQRLREKERELREEERRRRDIRRRQREEEQRLAREREKLQLERERLEREKAELLRLERERQKLEREKIELERLELKRQQMKIMQSSRIEEKRSLKRSAVDDRYGNAGDRKRGTSDRQFEAPPPPRFDSSIARSSDNKRDDYSSSKRDDYKRDMDVPRHSSSYHSSRDTHKESRYSEPDPRSNFRRGGGGDDRDSRNTSSKRFDGPSYVERSSGGSSSQWHNPGPPAIKSFAGSTMQSSSSGAPSWQTKSSEGNHWRPVDTSQDRYDRTYNERSGPYMEPSRQGGMFVGRPQMSSRYENGKY